MADSENLVSVTTVAGNPCSECSSGLQEQFHSKRYTAPGDEEGNNPLHSSAKKKGPWQLARYGHILAVPFCEFGILPHPHFCVEEAL